MKKSTLLLLTILFAACGTINKAYYSDDALNWQDQKSTSGKEIVHQLYLVGDTGEIDDLETGNNIVVDAVKEAIKGSGENTSLVYLGDNIYPHGMPKKDAPDREISERIINAQLDAATLFNGKTYFIPGNHDWNKHKKGGLKAIKRQEKYIESYLGEDNKKIRFYPNDGCADPKVVKINKDLVFVFLDTQWWLHDWSKEKKMNRGCEIKSRQDFLKHIEEIFTDHKNDEIVVMLHHPTKSNGLHGGNFSWKHHLFPVHEKNIWVPLPIIGSLYPIYRQVTGSKQDITHVKNKELMQGMEAIAKKLRINIVFASGHDHGMQFFDDNKIKYIVSGGGGKTDFVKSGGQATYAKEARGYARIDFYEDFEAWLEIFTIDPLSGESTLEFRTELRAPRAGTIQEEETYPSLEESTTTIAANKKFKAGGIKKAFLGKQYRDMWATPVEAENINLEKKLGGLTPVKKGGGMASNSLRMQHDNGKQYILRSIKKDYTKLVPPNFTNLKLIDVLADQNSASHPYGALVIPRLSQAVGVYYTHPKLVYLKHQKGLGNYNSQFPEELYLLEERPSGNWNDDSKFGNSEEIIGYADLLEILRTKKQHFIDQEWVLKSRIFDLLIHDWDRHDDQWRWASFKDGDKTTYRPIPRDRDQAFYKFVGVVPWYISQFMVRKFKTMKDDVKDVKNLAFNAQHFDRYFMHDLEWSEWQEVIHKMQKDLKDEDIIDAMNYLPSEVKSLNDEELISKLKSRRDKLESISKKLYDFLSKEVEISATDNKDRFEIQQNTNGSLNVKWFVTRKNKGDILKYDRTFYPNETKVVRLYGLRGKDEFNFSGEGSQKIKVSVIGGEDDDEIKNESALKIYAYDDLEGIDYYGDNIVDKRSAELEVNEYDRSGFKYNTSFPLVFFGNTIDDGFWFGGAISWTKHAWRKDPYKSRQSFNFSVAPTGNEAARIGYSGHFPNAFGKLDFAPISNLDFARYENYFGLGNNSVEDPNRVLQYNWVRIQSIHVAPLIQKTLGSATRLRFGPYYDSQRTIVQEDRVASTDDAVFNDDQLERRNYLGGEIDFNVSFADNRIYPHNGFNFNTNFRYGKALGKDETVGQFSTELAFYIKLFQRPNIVLANGVGYQKAFGDLLFHQYADLGNDTNLRGFRNNRFRGESSFYHNVDLRMHMFKWRNNIIPMDIGLVLGYDNGRVWFEDEVSDEWQNSQTIGLSLDILGATVIQPYYSFTEDGNRFSLTMGFTF